VLSAAGARRGRAAARRARGGAAAYRTWYPRTHARRGTAARGGGGRSSSYAVAGARNASKPPQSPRECRAACPHWPLPSSRPLLLLPLLPAAAVAAAAHHHVSAPRFRHFCGLFLTAVRFTSSCHACSSHATLRIETVRQYGHHLLLEQLRRRARIFLLAFACRLSVTAT
jgi:hypothetical protein